MVGEAKAGKRLSASRENIFSAVRRNLGNRNPNFAADYERISRDYEVAGKLSPEERLHLL
jgi:hypothetical protein